MLSEPSFQAFLRALKQRDCSQELEIRTEIGSMVSHIASFFWANLRKVQVMARHMIAFCPTSRKMYHGNRSICSECTMKIRQAQTFNVIPSVMWVLFDMAVLVATRQQKYKLLAPPIRRKRQKKWLVIWDHHPKQGVQNPKVNKYLRKMLKLQPNQPVNWWITESTKAFAHAVRWCGQRAIEVGHFPLGPAARNVKRTYHWPIIGRCHPIYLSYLNYHTSLSQVRNTNCNWHMVSWCFMSHQFACHFCAVWLPAINLGATVLPVPPLRGTGRLFRASLDTTALPSATKGTSGTSTWTPALWTIADVKPVSCG